MNENGLIDFINAVSPVEWITYSLVILSGVAFVIYILKSGKEYRDAWAEGNPNIPDARKTWCRTCKGHYEAYAPHREYKKCSNCGSTDNHSVRPITLWTKVLYSSSSIIFFLMAISAQVFEVKSEPPIEYFFYGSALFCGLVFGFAYKRKLAVRKEWLIWAKERGFEENAGKI